MTGVGELAAVFAVLPSSVNKLGLSANMLGKIPGKELATAFVRIPSTVEALDLSNNELNEETAAEMTVALNAIPPTVTELNLSFNFVGGVTALSLKTVLEALPRSLTKLNLSWIPLDEITPAELNSILAALPEAITSLDLTRCFQWLTGGERNARLFQVIKAMPQPSSAKILLNSGKTELKYGDILARLQVSSDAGFFQSPRANPQLVSLMTTGASVSLMMIEKA